MDRLQALADARVRELKWALIEESGLLGPEGWQEGELVFDLVAAAPEEGREDLIEWLGFLDRFQRDLTIAVSGIAADFLQISDHGAPLTSIFLARHCIGPADC